MTPQEMLEKLKAEYLKKRSFDYTSMFDSLIGNTIQVVNEERDTYGDASSIIFKYDDKFWKINRSYSSTGEYEYHVNSLTRVYPKQKVVEYFE